MKVNALGRLFVVAAVVGLPASGPAQSQGYPSKPIRFVVGFTPGGTTDILARELGARVQESWGRSVVVDNRPGAGGNIAAEVVAKSPPDGHTLLVSTNSFAINPAIYARLTFDPVADFTPITFMGSVTNIIIAHPSVPVRSIKDLIALARTRPGQVTYGSGGVGTSPQLAVELLKSLAKIDLVHVPYKGVPPVIQGLLSGEVALGVASLPSAGIPDLVRSGRVRGLALTGAKRSPAVPNVPTIAESGFPGFDVEIWYGLIGPAGMAPDIVAKLNKEIIRILELPVVRERLAAFDFAISTSTPAEFSAYIKKELGQWSKVVKEAGMAPIN